MKEKAKYPEQIILKALRDRAGWTLNDAARRSGLNRATISLVENGRIKPGTIVKKKLFALYTEKFPNEVKTMDDIFLSCMCTTENIAS